VAGLRDRRLRVVEFRPVCLEDERDFLLEMFVILAYESAPDTARRPGLNRFREQWQASDEAQSILKAVESSLADPKTVADVVIVDGVPAGFVWATFEGRPFEEKYYELRYVAFKLNFQRQGLGGLAVHHVEERAVEHGATAIRATGSADRESIRRFHASLGFKPIQTIYEKQLPVSV
jgi:GNAT superfamily N-acetyltransferase